MYCTTAHVSQLNSWKVLREFEESGYELSEEDINDEPGREPDTVKDRPTTALGTRVRRVTSISRVTSETEI